MAIGLKQKLDWETGALNYVLMVQLQTWFQAQVCFPNLYIVYY